MKKKLADWSPKLLQNLYASVLERLASDNLNQREVKAFTKRAEAIYRLGTHQDMKEVWEKLLAKKAVFIKYPVDKEQALIGTIQELMWFNSFGAERATPSENTEQLKEISKKIKELQRLIKKSGQASYEDKEFLETILHKRNVEYRNQHGEKIGSQSPNYLKFIDINANAELSTLPLDEHMPWKQRSQAQRLGWWTREAMGMSLNEILDYYSERMGDYSKVYKTHYGQFQPKLIKGLKDLMKELYGSPLEDYVGRIASAILNKEITKDYVRGYKE
jgi:hypothetical protein